MVMVAKNRVPSFAKDRVELLKNANKETKMKKSVDP